MGLEKVERAVFIKVSEAYIVGIVVQSVKGGVQPIKRNLRINITNH